MRQFVRWKWLRYVNSVSMVTCLTLAIGIMLFSMADCWGEAYEIPERLIAQEILPPELQEGKDFRVFDDVETYGFNYHFTMGSPHGLYEVNGEDMLRIRQQEIGAIGTLEEIKKSKHFAKGVKEAAKSPFKGVWKLITNPVDTVPGVGKGTWRFMTRYGEMTKGGRGELEESVAKEIIGFSGVKRELGYKLGVDVYSSNKELQKELNSISWAGYSGGMSAKIGMMGIALASTTAHIVVSATGFIDNMNELLRDNAPEDLRRLNRKKLKEMGVDKTDIKLFLRHAWYSPRHETILVGALAEMEGVKGRDQFIKQASFVENETDAFFFQRVAEMMRGYHIHVNPITEIIPVRSIVVAYTAEKNIVVTLPVDYVYWTEALAIGADALVEMRGVDLPFKRKELWLTGKISSIAWEELENKGIVVKERQREKLLPPAKEEPAEEEKAEKEAKEEPATE